MSENQNSESQNPESPSSENPVNALEAIHQEALKLITLDLPENVQEGLELIISLARYGFDVRPEDEKSRSESNQSLSESNP